MHAGAFGDDCAACHNASGWTPARLAGQAFDHAGTGFALDTHTVDFGGQAFTCQGCHLGATSDPASLSLGTRAACTACHTTAAERSLSLAAVRPSARQYPGAPSPD